MNASQTKPTLNPNLINEQSEQKTFYTVSQVALLVNMSIESIYRAIKSGELPHYQMAKKIIRVEQGQLLQWVEDKKVDNSK